MDTIPNTYIFTKALTEHIVNDYKDNLPLAIVRPAVGNKFDLIITTFKYFLN